MPPTSPSPPPPIPSPSSSTLRHFNPATNRYPAKKPWPPDIASMEPKHQFRLERRFRRRSQIAYLRPTWIRRTRLAQYTAILGVLVYAVLGIDWDVKDGGPFAPIRKWVGVEHWKSPFDVKTVHKRIEDARPGSRRPPPALAPAPGLQEGKG